MSGYRLDAPGPKQAEVRKALLIGVASYDEHRLKTPLQDVALVAAALEERGFDCELLLDPEHTTIDERVESFSTSLSDADFAVIYYAGHAYEQAGEGTVLPVDFPFPPSGVKLFQCGFPVARFEDALRPCRGAGVLILDACRVPLQEPDDRMRWAQGAEKFRSISNHNDLVVVWSTSAGDVAWDGLEENSVFAKTFAAALLRHDLDLDRLFATVGRDVEATPRRQRGWYKSSLSRTFRFSDLPRYGHVCVVPTPLPPRSRPLWMSRDTKGTNLTVCGGSRAVFEVRASGARPVSGIALEAAAIAVERTSTTTVVIDEQPSITLCREDRVRHALRHEPFGLRLAPDGRHAIAWGNDAIEVFELSGASLRLIRRFRVDWWPYGVVFQDAKVAWIVGSDGVIAKLDVCSAKLKNLTRRNPHAGHLYDITVLPTGDLAVVGGRGVLRILRPQKGAPARLPSIDDSAPVNPSQATSSEVGAAVLAAHQFDELDLLFCDVAPGLPLLATAGQGGRALLVDIRNGQLAGSFNIGAAQDYVQGLAFLHDGTLAILGSDAAVHFSAAIS